MKRAAFLGGLLLTLGLGINFGLNWGVVSSNKEVRVNSKGELVNKKGSDIVKVESADMHIHNGTLMNRKDDIPVKVALYEGTKMRISYNMDEGLLRELAKVEIIEWDGSKTVCNVNGYKYNKSDRTLEIYTNIDNMILYENGSIFWGDDNTGFKELNGYFNYIDKGVVFNDSSWWRMNYTDREDIIRMASSIKSMLMGEESQVMDEIRKAWVDFKIFFEKNYEGSEDSFRMGNFLWSIKRIVEINLNSTLTWWAAPNQYSDMDYLEFFSKILLKDIDINVLNGSNSGNRKILQSGFPLAVDWRRWGYVSSVKNQGSCGSCWAFATAGMVESAYLISSRKNGTIDINFSEQQLIDCEIYGSRGCNGGSSTRAINYIANNNITLESLYPYRSISGVCAAGRRATLGVQLKNGYKFIQQRSAAALALAVSRQPVINYIMVANDFYYYSGGIYKSTACSVTTVNHAMLIVGYDWNAKYWIIKNSWDSWWGEKGYVRVSMLSDGTTGTCGMYLYSFYSPPEFSVINL